MRMRFVTQHQFHVAGETFVLLANVADPVEILAAISHRTSQARRGGY